MNCQVRFEITEFQLGMQPMYIFISEFKENMGIPIQANVSNVTMYKGIKISEHPSNDAVMYCLKLR
jgi:hypothetical protein